MEKYLLIGLGGFLGSMGRYWVSVQMSDHQYFPFGTLIVNLVGCFLIGMLSALFALHILPPGSRFLLMVGLMGGFTTFSSFGLETQQLLHNGKNALAFVYAGGSIMGGIILAGTGIKLGNIIAGYFSPIK